MSTQLEKNLVYLLSLMCIKPEVILCANTVETGNFWFTGFDI